ncbi:DUF2283 domain-containing protein [Candidatus Woesearchaeota archaeon]|nr:DUF2283 domain-containing protein [Candidatus Woesearchaeota archaeon]
MGEHSYDFENDILTFKIKDRNYSLSEEFNNLVMDIDTEGFITGLRIFDASKVFKLSKQALNCIKSFEFHTEVENNIINFQLRFQYILRNKKTVIQGQDFIREATDSTIKNSEVSCSTA